MNKTLSKLFLALLAICFSYNGTLCSLPISMMPVACAHLKKGLQYGCKSVGKLSLAATQGLLALAGGVIAADALGTPSESSTAITSCNTPVCITKTSTGVQTEAPSFNFSPTITQDPFPPLDMIKKPSNNPLITSEKLKQIHRLYYGQAPANQPAPQATNPLPKAAATIPTQKPPAEIPKITTQNPTTSPESPAACSLTDAIKNKASEIKDSACDKASKVFSDATNATSSWISKTYNSASPYLISGAIIYAVAGYVYIYGVKRAQATNHWKSLSAAEQNKIPTHAVDHGSRIDNGILDKIFLPFVGWQYCCEKWIGNGKILFLI